MASGVRCWYLLTILTCLLPATAYGVVVGDAATRHILQPPSDIHQRAPKEATGVEHDTMNCPKVFIISMFDSEAEVWLHDQTLDLYANNITVPGFSPLFPQAHCTGTGQICLMTTGEGEINAAASLSALWLSNSFDLTTTYFLISGISGGNPLAVTTGSVTFPRFAVQVSLQYEFDRSQNAYYPDEYKSRDYPGEIYGTEAFELNERLVQRAFEVGRLASLNDSKDAARYREKYNYAPANQSPSVVRCDSVTSDNYWSGSILGDAFSNYTLLLTNGSGSYCGTQQEDNASLGALLRGAIAGRLDFSRIIIMRSISDFDRAPPGETEIYHLLFAEQAGYDIAIINLRNVGMKVIEEILSLWGNVYHEGVVPVNYIGDLFNSLPGAIAPTIGTESIYIN